MKDFVIYFHPLGKKVFLNRPTTILEAANRLNFNIIGPCGGNGKCGKCKVRILRHPQDTYMPPDENSKRLLTDSELKRGYRLACTTVIKDDIDVELPPWSLELVGDRSKISSGILANGEIDKQVELKFTLDPVIKIQHCSLPKPTLDNNISDLERLGRCICSDLKIDKDKIALSRSMMSLLTQRLHENDWQVDTVISFSPLKTEILDVLATKGFDQEKKEQNGRCYGIALDIGTSTIVAYLLNLITGAEVGVAFSVNPQIRIGADVISRIRFTMEYNEGIQQLSMMLGNTINDLIKQLCAEARVEPENIYELVAVGNPTMLLSFLGIPVSSLGTAPYTPAFNGDYYTRAANLKLNTNKNGQVYVGPIVAGFLGADAIGSALVTNMLDLEDPGSSESKVQLALDIGTNGEILLKGHNRIVACSAAAGPAFEGGNLQFGIRACPGAVFEISIRNRMVEYSTIDGKRSLGITGSGVVDGISEFRRVGAISEKGTIDQDTNKKWLKYPKRIKLKDTMGPTSSCDLVLPELMIVPRNESDLDTAITITQNDIREIQLAKAAIRTGIEILMSEVGVTVSELDELYLAGAFGNYIKQKSAIGINLLPKIKPEKIKAIGNAAGTGAKILLRSSAARKQVVELAKKIEYIDLATHPKFQDLFIWNMDF